MRDTNNLGIHDVIQWDIQANKPQAKRNTQET